jgi:hypothetical protein
MASVVVVTTVEVDHKTLARLVQPGDDVHVVVPAVEQSRLQWLTNAEDEPRAHAAETAEHVARRMPASEITAEEKPDPPSLAVADAVRQYRPDRVVVVLREEGEAGWLESGELDRIPAEIDGVPVERRRL